MSTILKIYKIQIWLFANSVSIVPNSHLFPKQMMWHARSAWWLWIESYAPRKPHALASTPATPKEKTLLAFLIWRGWIFSWKRKGCFSFGVLPSKYSGSAWGFNADEVLAKLFFGEERICQNFGWFVFEFGSRKWKRRGLGRNFPFAPLISFGEIRAGFLTQKIQSNQSVDYSEHPRNNQLNMWKWIVFFVVLAFA